MKSAIVDDRRRVTMPAECPPNSEVTISQVDEDTWILKRHRDEKNFKVIILPVVDRLPDDPDWEKMEESAARHAASTLPPPEFK